VKHAILLTVLLAALARPDTYLGFGPAYVSGTDEVNYWFCGAQYFHRQNLDTKIKFDCATNFVSDVFLSGAIGLNYYFPGEMFLAGFDFGFGSDFNLGSEFAPFGFTGGLSVGIALAQRTFMIEPSLLAMFKRGLPLVAGLKVGLIFGKNE
jgi:hypothetical protein